MRTLLGSLLALVSAVHAQETRGMIFGRVLDAQRSAVAGAKVTVTHIDTNTLTSISTNDTGYYEAPLLLPGGYQVSAEAAGFRAFIRKGITLQVSARIEVDIDLQVGAVSDSVTITAEAPLIDTASSSSGRVVDNRTQSGIPLSSGNVSLFARMAPGVQFNGEVRVIGPGDQVSNSDYGVGGRVGGNEWAVDGASNNGGAGRRVGYVAHSDEISEIKIETSGFDSSIGHTTGMVISMMTKSGTNNFHGGGSNIHEQTRFNSTPFFTRQLYYRNIAAAESAGNSALANQLRNTEKQLSGRRNHYSGFIGGPLIIPKVYNGKDKLFFFVSYVGFQRLIPPNPINFNHTFPTLTNRDGDFSQLLQNDATRYQIYDPLSVRPDPARPGNYIRTPISGNVLPKSRIVNPLYPIYTKWLPTPNNNPIDPKLEPLNNYLGTDIPWTSPYNAISNRIDYRQNDKTRYYGRWTYDDYKLDALDWAFRVEKGLQSQPDRRHNVSGVIDAVYTPGSNTVIDLSVSANMYEGGDLNKTAAKYKPSDVGLPKYMDDKAGLDHILPTMNFDGYNSVGYGGVFTISRYRNYASKLDVSHVRGKHSFRAGVDFRIHHYEGGGGGNTSGAFTFTNAYTRRNDDTFTPAGNLGLSWAAFMMGIPSSMQIATTDSFAVRSPYTGWHVQDNWRVTTRLNVNFGLRMEYEMGPKERYDRWVGTFDPTAKLPISDAAKAAYAANPIPELGASAFNVAGGSVYPGSNGGDSRARRNELMLMPRIGAAYSLSKTTVLRGGYGMFFDSLNALTETVNQLGFSRTTSTNITNDFGVNWLAGDPRNGVLPLADPFPVRADGTRFDAPFRDKLGLMSVAGRGYSYQDFDTRRARQHRWRGGVQHQFGSAIVVEAAYTGSYSDRVYITKNMNPLPANFWNTSTVRNDAIANNLNANVVNPFLLSNFASLQSSNPLAYQDMSTQSFFTSRTIRKNQLLRPYPQLGALSVRNAPFGEVKTHDIQLSVEKRFSRGFNFYASYTRLWDRDRDVYLNEYDTEPTWRDSNNGRPHRLLFNAIWELPFGKGRPFTQRGLLSHIVGGWQLGAAWELQPGPLLDFGNLYYYGNLADINTGDRTFDRWFNTANFERSAAKAPAVFQARVFPTRIDGLRADPTNIWNGNVIREFAIKERTRFQVRLEGLNLANRTQFGAPDTNPLNSTFGKVTVQSQTNKRSFQAVARITF